MPYYMRTSISVDRQNRTYRLAVLWDDHDINSVVCEHTFGSMPTGGGYDPEKVYVTDEEIDRELARMGFAIVGKDAPALAWGERIVQRANSDFKFFDPGTREWYTVDPNTTRSE